MIDRDRIRQNVPQIVRGEVDRFVGATDWQSEDEVIDLLRIVAASRAKGRARYVYFLERATDWAIKIGVSYRPAGRQSEMRVKFQTSVALLAQIPGTARTEQLAHARFAHDRIDGEWFTTSPELREFVALANRAPEEALALLMRRP